MAETSTLQTRSDIATLRDIIRNSTDPVERRKCRHALNAISLGHVANRAANGANHAANDRAASDPAYAARLARYRDQGEAVPDTEG